MEDPKSAVGTPELDPISRRAGRPSDPGRASADRRWCRSSLGRRRPHRRSLRRLSMRHSPAGQRVEHHRAIDHAAERAAAGAMIEAVRTGPSVEQNLAVAIEEKVSGILVDVVVDVGLSRQRAGHCEAAVGRNENESKEGRGSGERFTQRFEACGRGGTDIAEER